MPALPTQIVKNFCFEPNKIRETGFFVENLDTNHKKKKKEKEVGNSLRKFFILKIKFETATIKYLPNIIHLLLVK